MRASLALAAWLIGALPLALIPQRSSAQALQPIPPLNARVTDLTGTLTAAQQADLEQKLADFQARKGAQLAVLLVPTTAPETIEQYSIRVVEAWKLGRKNVDDGALLLIARNDHTVRIESGYGLEGVLTDIASNRIIDETMVPLLRQGQYYAAINAALDQMIRLIDGEALPAPDQSWQGPHVAPVSLIGPLIVVVLIGGTLLRALFGRLLGAALTGAGAGLLTFALTQALWWGIGAGTLAYLAAMLLGAGGGGWSSRSRGSPPTRYGGWGGPWGGLGGGGWGGLGGGGGFGGGGGGFSGGGGGFGGGGASGRW
jgi:uncharacterized protein